MFCQHCKSVMKRVYRFENGKSYKLWKCPKCYIETKPRPYRFTDELEVSQNNTPTNKPIKKPIKKLNKKKRGN